MISAFIFLFGASFSSFCFILSTLSSNTRVNHSGDIERFQLLRALNIFFL